MQLTCSTNRSTTATLNSSSNSALNLSSAGVRHLTDAYSFLLRSPRLVFHGISLAETFFPLQLPDLSALLTLHFISYVCLWTLLCYRLWVSTYRWTSFTSMNFLKLPGHHRISCNFKMLFLGAFFSFNSSFLHSHKQTCLTIQLHCFSCSVLPMPEMGVIGSI